MPAPLSVYSSPRPAAICCITRWIEPAYVSPLIGVTLAIADVAPGPTVATLTAVVSRSTLTASASWSSRAKRQRILLFADLRLFGHRRGWIVRVELLGGPFEELAGLLGDALVDITAEGLEQWR